MALRKFSENTPNHADDGIGDDGNPESTGYSQDIKGKLQEVKDQLLKGNVSALDNLPVPDEVKARIKAMLGNILPVTEAALNEAVADLLGLARKSVREERTLGKPGPLWDEYLDAIRYYTKIEEKDILQTMLVARLVYLLMATIEELGRDVKIDPQNPKYKYED